MKLKNYIQIKRGNASQLARDIGVFSSDVSMYASGVKPIPHKYGALIEKHTNGLVTRQELFPDEWQSIWPELIKVA
jgi:DNA-binding transcriptional regulator YdaS (Cro superfamily)